MLKFQRRWCATGYIVTAVCVVALSGCVLNTEGTLGSCPDGKLVCTVSTKEYDFDSRNHAYRFVGRCEIKRDDLGSEFGDPLINFTVRGHYDVESLEFAEVADFDGRFESSAHLTGSSTRDPWLFTSWPVALKNYAGDPNALANQFCVDGIPPEYYHIPFSRNVIIHMLSNNERLLLAKAATDARNTPPPDAPPPPPCPYFQSFNPPAMYMPTPGLVYPEHVDGITVYLTSECGVPSVNYERSRFQVEFEHFNEGWQPFTDYQVKMSYRPEGGSVSSTTLPLNATGLWRVRARQLLVQMHQDEPRVGEYGSWVTFNIGPPQYEMSQIDSSIIPKVPLSRDSVRGIHRAWDTSRSRSMDTLRRAADRTASDPGGRPVAKPVEDD